MLFLFSASSLLILKWVVLFITFYPEIGFSDILISYLLIFESGSHNIAQVQASLKLWLLLASAFQVLQL